MSIQKYLIAMGIFLVTNSYAQEIIIQNNAPFAADELRVHLEKITNRKFTVVPEDEFKGNQPAFYVGQSRFAQKAGIDFSKFTPEEWIYLSVGNNVILGGHRVNGTEYAVWKFLENELNVRWFTFESVYIPKQENLSFKNLNRRGKPAFAERQIYSSPWKQGFAHEILQKNIEMERRNRINAAWSPVILSKQTNHCHSFYDYVSPEKYFKSHPEYFSMDKDGKRFHGSDQGFGQLCLSNPEVAEVATKHLVEYIRKDRASLPREKWPTMYDISQLDSTYEICLCPECKKLTVAEGSDSALIVLFLNRIAAAVKNKYPEITLRTFAYVSTEKAPKTLRPAENVQIRWCDVYTRSDCFRPLTSKYNKEQKNILDGWKQKGARLSLWDYWNMIIDGPYFTPPRVETVVDAIAPDLRYFHSIGVEMLFIEAETSQFANPQNFYDLHFWLGAQLMDDVNKNEEVLITDFMKYHYGPAAGKMTEVLNLLRNSIRKEPDTLFYIIRALREYQTGPFLREVYDLLHEARNLTPSHSDYRCRVEKELITPIAVILSHPELETGLNRAKLVSEYEELRLARIEKYAAADKKAELREKMESELTKYRFAMKIPEKFKKYAADKIRLVAFPHFSQSEVDPDSVTGRALGSPAEERDCRHIMKPQAGYLKPTWFGVYDNNTRKSLQYRLDNIPQDEKYHWYRLGNFEIGKRSFVWGFFWRMDVKLDHLWSPADGDPDYNKWTIWISAKITGPAYVKNSTKPNRIFLDQVVLVKE